MRDRHRPGRRASTALGVKVDGVEVEADAVVIAMGPWSMAACRWLPLPAVYGLKGNSVVYQSGSKISADALFVELTTADGAAHTPEVFPRADGTTYVCGLSSQQALPDDPADVAAGPGGAGRAASDDPRSSRRPLPTPRSWRPRPASGR